MLCVTQNDSILVYLVQKKINLKKKYLFMDDTIIPNDIRFF